MIEKHIVLEDIDPVLLYGAGNNHLQMIRALFPKLRIVARDNVIRVLGDEEQMCAFEENIETMRKHVLKFNRISEEDILEIVKGKKTADEMNLNIFVVSHTTLDESMFDQRLFIDKKEGFSTIEYV